MEEPVLVDFTLRRDWVRGKRSPQDGQDWTCGCLFTNEATKHMLFNLPKFFCNSCGKKYMGLLDFCIADILINKQMVIPKPKNQGQERLCVAYAISHLLEILYLICCAVNGEEPDPNFIVDPAFLAVWYKHNFPRMMGPIKPYAFPGLHKIVAMMEMLRTIGIRIQDKYICKVHQISCISLDDFEKICIELAEGNPLLAVFVPGNKFDYLQYCQIYQPPQQNIGGISHMVVLLGAFQLEDGFRGFYFMNSSGELWCARYSFDFTNKSWSNTIELVKHMYDVSPRISGGVGKVSNCLLLNVIKFCRPGEEDNYRKLENMKEPYDLSMANVRALMDSSYASQSRRGSGRRIDESDTGCNKLLCHALLACRRRIRLSTS